MSDIAKGSARVGSVLSQLSRLGYRCMRASASGQAKGKRRQEKLLAGDLIGFAPADSMLPHVLGEVGGEKKIVSKAIAAMLEGGPLPPGFVAVVFRMMPNRRWRYSRESGAAFSNLVDALRQR